VAAGDRALDDEAVGPDLRVAVEEARQHRQRDDRQEFRTPQLRQVVTQSLARVEARDVGVGAVRDLDREGRRTSGRELGQQPRQLARDSRAHQHVVDPREHGAQRGRQGRGLDLLQQVDADDAVVALLGEPDLGEVADQAQLDGPLAGVDGERRVRPVGLAGRTPALPVVGRQHARRDRRRGEVLQRPADVSARVAVLQAPRDDRVQGGAGDDAQLAEAGDDAGELPRRDGHPHAPLDDHGPRGRGFKLRRRYGHVTYGTVT